MAEIDEQLVRQIAEQVLAALKVSEVGGTAAVRPPAGVCTGDYSRFAELQGRPIGAPPPPAPVDEAAALAGIITAQQLQEAMDASAQGLAVIAPEARLTPLANDLARQNPQKICRLAATEPPTTPGSPASPGPPTTSAATRLPWLWWADGYSPAVHQLTQRLRDRLQATAALRAAGGLAQVVRDLADAVTANRVAGGVLFVQAAALAVCFANRCPSLRAVVGTCGEAVEQGIRELGANVLVIEYPHVAADTMDAMVQRMLGQLVKTPAHVQRVLADLQRG